MASPRDVFSRNYNPAITLATVKNNLNKGILSTFGMLIDSNPKVGQGIGAVGRYLSNNDAWMYTTQMASDYSKGYFNSGHEMIIVGYNDNIVVTDPVTKQTDKGVLILRNSWGPYAGDGGTYFVTYQYFQKFTNEVYSVQK